MSPRKFIVEGGCIMSLMFIHHHFLGKEGDSQCWSQLLKQSERSTGLQLERLDKRDPIRRKVKADSWDEQGEFVVTFGSREQSRWILGRFTDGLIRCRIQLYRDKPNYSNVMVWTIPLDAFGDDRLVKVSSKLFALGNRVLKPFYATADTEGNLASKSKRSGYGVDLRVELHGVFWLTYFNKQYRNFFGAEKLASIPEVTSQRGGVTLQLGDSPLNYNAARRLQIETILGKQCFVDPKSRREKEPGKHVLSYAELGQDS